MGQTSSTSGNAGGATSPTNKSKPPRPSEPPKLPKIPNYVVPENKVIPNGIGDMENARKLLRPVSQELRKFHPDFSDIFHYDPEENFLAGNTEDNLSLTRDKENSTPYLSSTSEQLSGVCNNIINTSDPCTETSCAVTNGSSPMLNANLSSQSVGNILENEVKDSNLKRTHSLGRDRSNQPRVLKHKRQSSLTNGIPLSQQPVIPEDPREHLYNVTRHQPFSNLIPANTSLPLKNSFQSDYSLNLTYAQLAEYRRQQRNADLESKTAQKLKDLCVEIDATNNTPKSPFDRANLGTKSKSSMHSASTGSSEAGVSKSKKKKAAPPPPPPPLEKEPPADYDIHDFSSNTSLSLQRRNSSTSGNLRTSALELEPKSKRMPLPTTYKIETNQIARQSTAGNSNQDPSLTQVSTPPPPTPPSPPTPPPPPPLPAGERFTKPATVNSPNEFKPDEQIPNGNNKIQTQTPLHKSMHDAKAQLEMLKQMAAMLKAPTAEPIVPDTKKESEVMVNPPKENILEPDVPLEIYNVSGGNRNKTNIDGNSAATESVTSQENGSDNRENYSIPASSDTTSRELIDSPGSQVKKMNSLLQHDIILAAKAQGVKQKKTRQPPAFEKPKDEAQMFREELQKAAQAREERRKAAQQNGQQAVHASNDTDGAIELDESASFTSQRQRQRFPGTYSTEATQSIIERSLSKAIPDLSPIGQNGICSTRSSASFENMSISSNNSQRVYSSGWTPEEDLEPDDDILQDKNANDIHSAKSEGFKSSIVPMKVKDLKEAKGKKNKAKKQKNQSETTDIATDVKGNKNKFGSIHRFKKTVHENVRNAFGSISKTSGKLLKKNKSQDFLSMVPDTGLSPVSPLFTQDLDASDNWELLGDGEAPLRRSMSADFIQHPYQSGNNDYFDEYSDEHFHSDAEIDDIDFASGIDDDPKTKKSANRKSAASQIRKMKRAGVAYVSGTGQIIVLPEYNTVSVDAEGNEVGKTKDDEGRAPKLSKKKDKKLIYESTARMQERNRRDEIVTRQIREKEHHIERDRLRQQEIERDFRRLRDLDTQERLQRMQTDSILQQLTFLQQQQVRQAHLDINTGVHLHQAHQAPLMKGSSPIPNPLQNQQNSLINFSNLPQRHSYPKLPESPFTNQVGHPTSASSDINNGHSNRQPSPRHPNVSPTINTPHYTAHNTPIIGHVPSPSATAFTNSMPNLSVQDLNYLSGYMKMMGVAPPANQQQWAFLLSSVSINPNNFSSGNANNTTNGPDFSQLFGIDKTLESTVLDSNKPTFYELFHKINSSDNVHANVFLSQLASPAQENTGKLVEVDSSVWNASNNVNHQNAKARKSDVSFQNVISSPEERLDALTSAASSPSTTNDTSKDSINSFPRSMVRFDDGAPDSTVSDPVSPRPPSKVYGPIGFKPVSFKTGAT